MYLAAVSGYTISRMQLVYLCVLHFVCTMYLAAKVLIIQFYIFLFNQ